MADGIEIAGLLRRLDAAERNGSDLAKTITRLVEELDEVRKPLDDLRLDRAVRAERDIRTTERFDRLEKKIDGVYRLGWWVLTTFGALTMAAVANLLYGGAHGP